jgi:AcrR family transcriptional regulator
MRAVAKRRSRDAGAAAGEAAPDGCAAADGQRRRILEAAFEVLMERGYAGASTLEIATRAKVSKRELYAQFGSKENILVAMITGRAARMQAALADLELGDAGSLAALLAGFGANVVREVCHPAVIALIRLAVIEAKRSPQVARTLDDVGRQGNRAALVKLLTEAQSRGLVGPGDPAVMAAQFFALLWGDLQMRLVLGVVGAPSPAEIEERARAAAAALLALHPPPAARPRRRRSLPAG